jgi:C-terminal processing protease CtpA/Prc
VQTAYRALVHDSIVAADPRIVATAALQALNASADRHLESLPVGFGSDADKDGAWLGDRMASLSSPWSVVDAMARSAATVHVGLGTPERRKGFRALTTGDPLCSPGFNLYSLPDGRYVVFDVVNGASAHSSGLRLGDVLRRVNGQPTARVDPFLLAALPSGTTVPLDLERSGKPVTVSLHLIKADVVPVESRLLDDRTAYLFVRWFARSTNPEQDTAALVHRAIAAFSAQGADRLILDLRSALGGIGDVSIASALCDGDTIYFVQKPLTSPPQPVAREGQRTWASGKRVAVLVNEQTVSAGEALALALRELGSIPIVGQTTAGGLTEMDFVPLAPGYSMTIPTGLVLGPVTRKDQPGHAVKPDVEIANPTIEELLAGRDRQLEAARAALAR